MGQLHRAGHQSEQSMTSVWKSNLPRHIKISFFSATVESVLLHGCECWTLTPSLQKSLDGCDTKMLHVALNIKQDEHIANNRLNVGLPSLSEKLTVRRMRLAGHCHWHWELPAKKSLYCGNQQTSIQRASHTYLRGCAKEKYWCGKHKRVGQMYGELRWLDMPMEDSSEDDAEREREKDVLLER